MIRTMILLILWENKRKEDARKEGDIFTETVNYIPGLKRKVSELVESAPEGIFQMEGFESVMLELLEVGLLQIGDGGKVIIGNDYALTHDIKNNLFLKTLATLLKGIEFPEKLNPRKT